MLRFAIVGLSGVAVNLAVVVALTMVGPDPETAVAGIPATDFHARWYHVFSFTAFLIAPIAQFLIIPYMNSRAGQNAFAWLLGEGQARGIALVFLIAGLVMVLVAFGALFTRSYRRISAQYLGEDESVALESDAI